MKREMKRDPLPEPERWSERGSGTSAEDVIGASLKHVRAATEPTDAAALHWARRAMIAPTRAYGRPIWSTAIVATVLMAGGAAAAVTWRAAVTKARARAQHDDRAPAATRPRPHGALARAGGPPAAALLDRAPPLVPKPAVEPAIPEPVPAPVATPRIARLAIAPGAGRTAARIEPPPWPAADPEDEAQLLARAFRQLRNEGDAQAALAALDERERRFAAGTLGTEAALARAEALLLLGRSNDALPILIGIRATRAGSTPEVRATRAELLTNVQRCAEAGADFDALLAPGAPAATRGRALYARASCRLRNGQTGLAAADLESYLAEFPDGGSAPIVRATLERLRRP